MSTNVVSARDVKRTWYHIDAKGKILGRLAVEAADKLRGKSKVNFVPYLDMGDYVVVTNAALVKVTGKKATDKTYSRHSGFPGGLRVETFNQMIAKKPEKVLEHAIKGMLPKGKLGDTLFTKLHVFSGTDHPYKKQLAGDKKVETKEVVAEEATQA
jgi:large subunit ribosomal protein L13